MYGVLKPSLGFIVPHPLSYSNTSERGVGSGTPNGGVGHVGRWGLLMSPNNLLLQTYEKGSPLLISVLPN